MSGLSGLRRLILLLMLPALLALVTVVQLPGDTALWRALQNAGHVPLFAVVTILLAMFLFATNRFRLLSTVWQYVLLLSVAASLALLTEWLQTWSGRAISLSDLRHDAYGIAAGALLFAAYINLTDRRGLHYLAVALAVMLLLGGLLPLFTAAWHSWQRDRAMPVVMDLSAPWSQSFVQYNHARNLGSEHRSLLQALTATTDFSEIVLQPAQYPGVEMSEPFADWSDYHRLTFVIHSAQPAAFDLVLRIHDAAHNQQFHDRFNRRLRVMPGDNQYHIELSAISQAPAGREMDMTQIDGITLFAVQLKQGRRFSISPLVLQK